MNDKIELSSPIDPSWLAARRELVLSAAGRREIEALTDELDEHLQDFSRTDVLPHERSCQCERLIELCVGRRSLIEAALISACARTRSPPLPREIYPHIQLRNFVRDVTKAGRRSPSRRLLTAVKRRDPVAWARFTMAVIEVGLGLATPPYWPTPAAAHRALRSLEQLSFPWTEVAAELRHATTRSQKKDDAWIRALNWRELFSWSLTCLRTLRCGPSRLWFEYLMALLINLVTMAERGYSSPAACSPVVLELFAFIEQYALLDSTQDSGQLVPGSRGHDEAKVRKNFQRGRLKALTRMIQGQLPREVTLTSELSWTNCLVPMFDELTAKTNTTAPLIQVTPRCPWDPPSPS